jgi:ParB family transcriptional regulator, chromosome partitioning protein
MVSHSDDPELERRESRRAQRRRMFKQVQVLSLDRKSASAIDCTLRNVSTSGAMLTGPGASLSRIPNQFYLVAPGQLRMIRCKVAWKTYDSVGVRFLSDPGHLASDPAGGAKGGPNGAGDSQLPTFSRAPEEQGFDRATETVPDPDQPRTGELPVIARQPSLEDVAAHEPEFCLLPLAQLSPGHHLLRDSLDQEELDGLAQSVRENGLLQPLIVRRRSASERYEIVAGERRWRAAKMAGLVQVPVLIVDISDGEALQIAMIENVQRSDLDALEEAKGYRQLIETFGYTQQHVADLIGKSRSHVANALRLLKLPDDVQAHLRSGKLTAGHLRTLASKNAPAELAHQIIDLDLNVRETERLVNAREASKAHHQKKLYEKDAALRNLEQSMSEHLRLKVEIATRPGSGGRIVVHFQTPEQFNDIYKLLMMRQA